MSAAPDDERSRIAVKVAERILENLVHYPGAKRRRPHYEHDLYLLAGALKGFADDERIRPNEKN